MKLSDNYMRTHDIDWFCCIDKRYLLHFASNGSEIPEFAADRELLQRAHVAVADIPLQLHDELRYNTQHIEELNRLPEYDETRYLASFKLFAYKGFYSFDYEWKNEEYGGAYQLLVGPSQTIDYPWRDYLMAHLPQVSSDDIDMRYRHMFRELLDQIRLLNNE